MINKVARGHLAGRYTVSTLLNSNYFRYRVVRAALARSMCRFRDAKIGTGDASGWYMWVLDTPFGKKSLEHWLDFLGTQNDEWSGDGGIKSFIEEVSICGRPYAIGSRFAYYPSEFQGEKPADILDADRNVRDSGVTDGLAYLHQCCGVPVLADEVNTLFDGDFTLESAPNALLQIV